MRDALRWVPVVLAAALLCMGLPAYLGTQTGDGNHSQSSKSPPRSPLSLDSGACIPPSCSATLAPPGIGGVEFWDWVDQEWVYNGGYNGTGHTPAIYWNYTWVYKGGIWTNITASAGRAPLGSYNAASCWDQADGYGIVWGGTRPPNIPVDTTYKFVGGHWTNITSTAGALPLGGGQYGIQSPAGHYDWADGYCVSFGGSTGVSVGVPVNYTYTFSAGTWTNITASSHGPHVVASGGNGLLGVEIDYDSVLGKVVLFGGTGNVNWGAYTWEFSAGTWTNITTSAGTPPRFTFYEVFQYDPSSDAVVEFGGRYQAQNGYTWEFNGTWHNVSAAAGTPPPATTLAWTDWNGTSVLVFGGQAQPQNIQYQDLWFYHAHHWTQTAVTTWAPPQPSKVVVTGATATTVSLSWTPPAGVTLANTSISYGPTCSSLTSQVSSGASASSFTVTGLSSGTSYCFGVTDWETVGSVTAHSETSNAVQETTGTAPLTLTLTVKNGTTVLGSSVSCVASTTAPVGTCAVTYGWTVSGGKPGYGYGFILVESGNIVGSKVGKNLAASGSGQVIGPAFEPIAQYELTFNVTDANGSNATVTLGWSVVSAPGTTPPPPPFGGVIPPVLLGGDPSFPTWEIAAGAFIVGAAAFLLAYSDRRSRRSRK